MLRFFSNMVPDALLTYLDLPRELGAILAVDRFSNFLFSQWPIHAAHSEYPLVVDLRTARRYENYSAAQQRCLLSFLQRAARADCHCGYLNYLKRIPGAPGNSQV